MIDYTSRITRYQRSQFDFGGGADDNMTFKGPKGKEGLLWDYGVYDISETFNGDTLDPQMSVGTAADPDHYGDEFSLTTALCPADTAGLVSVRTQFAPTAAGFAALMLIPELPADTAVYGVLKAATGANLTGTATAFVDCIWAN